MARVKVLVLGGTGFVGRNVMETLERGQIRCIAASRSTGTDLRNIETAKDLLCREKPDIIINCAAHVGSLNYVSKQAADVVADNSRMILNLYEAVAAKCPDALLINPIANCAYPNTASTFEEDHLWDGGLHRSVLSFGSTRRMLWCVGECFQMQHNIRSIHLLVPNMYGPYDSTDPNKAHALNALAYKFVHAEMTGKPEVVVWGTGAAVREWLFAADFARVVLDIVKGPRRAGLDEPLNIAQNFGLSVRELVNQIACAANFKGTVRYDHDLPDGASRKVMDDRRFRKVFPEFEFTRLGAGLNDTVNYYRSVHAALPER